MSSPYVLSIRCRYRYLRGTHNFHSLINSPTAANVGGMDGCMEGWKEGRGAEWINSIGRSARRRRFD